MSRARRQKIVGETPELLKDASDRAQSLGRCLRVIGVSVTEYDYARALELAELTGDNSTVSDMARAPFLRALDTYDRVHDNALAKSAVAQLEDRVGNTDSVSDPEMP